MTPKVPPNATVIKVYCSDLLRLFRNSAQPAHLGDERGHVGARGTDEFAVGGGHALVNQSPPLRDVYFKFGAAIVPASWRRSLQRI